jgi:hypothetical protein
MPKEMHDRLAKQAGKRGLSGDRRAAYIYGTMSRMKKGTKKPKK